MGYIPNDSEWYIAEIVMEIIVHGAKCNVVHRNLFLLKAHSPDEAYSKALRAGQSGETTYTNPNEQLVEIRFRGIAKLDVVYEPLEDGAELCFEEKQAVSESEIQAMIPAKEQLDVFVPPTPGKERDPDYRSKAVVEQVVRSLDGEREV